MCLSFNLLLYSVIYVGPMCTRIDGALGQSDHPHLINHLTGEGGGKMVLVLVTWWLYQHD